jgi:hypothetical protein
MIEPASILCIVLAHGAASDCVARHLPFWRQAAAEVIIFSPWDDPVVAGPEVTSHLHGCSSRYGSQNNVRVREALRFAAHRASPLTMLVEYDALTWGPIPEAARPPVGGLSGARFTEPREWAGTRFEGSQYFHFPILLDRAALAPLVAQMDALPVGAEGGYSDRYIGLAAERAGLPYVDLFAHGLAFTRDTIAGRAAERCAAAVAAGVVFSHGIKTRETLNLIRRATA